MAGTLKKLVIYDTNWNTCMSIWCQLQFRVKELTFTFLSSRVLSSLRRSDGHCQAEGKSWSSENASWEEKGSWLEPLSAWSLYVLPMSAWASLGIPVSSHIPEMFTAGELECLHCLCLRGVGWGSVCPVMEGLPAQVGSHMGPWAAERGSGHLQPWTR